jgi:hypothetical protein
MGNGSTSIFVWIDMVLEVPEVPALELKDMFGLGEDVALCGHVIDKSLP